MRFSISIKEIVFLLILWILLFIEPVSLGPIKVSQLWKGIAVIYLLTVLIKRKNSIIIWIGIIFAFKHLIYVYFPIGFLDALRLFMESLLFPAFLGFLFIKYQDGKITSSKLKHNAILLSIFLILSAVPFLFGLKSLNPEFDLSEKYGLDILATKGLFYHIASASKMFTVATLVIVIYRKWFWHSMLYKIVWFCLVLIGTYLIIMCWTRTGWAIYGFGLFLVLFYESKTKVKFYGFLGVIAIIYVVINLYETNEAFKWRLNGGASYRAEKQLSLEQLANARLPYIFVAIDNLKEEGLMSSFVGYGEQRGKELFERKTNMAITSHNGIFEILESNGIIGIVLYTMFVVKLFSKVLKNKKNQSPETRKAIFICFYLFTSFFLSSHGTPIWGEIIYAFLFAPLLIKPKLSIHQNNESITRN